jgi:hypothetical protein
VPKTIKEFDMNHGQTKNGKMYVREFRVLGHSKAAEGLLAWSTKHPVGTSYRRDTAWGLALLAKANSDNPVVALGLCLRTLHTFVSSFKALGSLYLMDQGVVLAGPDSDNKEGVSGDRCRWKIFIPQEKNTDSIELYSYEPAATVEDEPEKLLALGGILIGEEGFNYYTVEEAEELKASTTEEESATSEPTTTENNEPDFDIEDLLKQDREQTMVFETGSDY